MPDGKPVRLIATDVDGTLINSRGEIPPENIEAIHKAQENGIVVAIASGRFAVNVYLLLQEHGLSCPIIAVNGAKIVDENLKTISSCFMRHASALAVKDTLNALGSDYFVFGQDCLCTISETLVHHTELSQGDRVREMGYGYTHGREAMDICLQRPVQKFYVCDNVPLDRVKSELEKIPEIYLTQSAPNNIEIMPFGVDKGYGVRALSAILDIPLSQVMTLGDQENDIPMLQAAGYGVAMGNASLETKAAAKYVTKSNNDCGFAHAIEKWALSK